MLLTLKYSKKLTSQSRKTDNLKRDTPVDFQRVLTIMQLSTPDDLQLRKLDALQFDVEQKDVASDLEQFRH